MKTIYTASAMLHSSICSVHSCHWRPATFTHLL